MSQRFMVAVLAMAGTFAAAIESSHLVRTSGESRRIRSALDDLTAAVEAEGGQLEVRALTEEEAAAFQAERERMATDAADAVLDHPHMKAFAEGLESAFSKRLEDALGGVDTKIGEAVAGALDGLDGKIAEAVAKAVAAAVANAAAASTDAADPPPARRERRSHAPQGEAPAAEEA